MNILPEAVWATAWRRPDRRPIREWAHERVILPPVLTRSGPFQTETSRHFESPLDAIGHVRVRGVRMLKPVRGGGTLVADVALPWAIENDHASVLMVFQDDKIADAHSETRTMPIVKAVPSIRSMLSDDRHKTRKSDILFANGLPLVLTGPAIGNLQSRGFKWVICDEPWLYAPGVLGQAKARLGDFVKMSSSKFIAISQGGEEDSEWDFECRAGVLFVWSVPCEGCGELFAPEWTYRMTDNTYRGVVFDSIKLEDGSYDAEASAATVRYVCHRCGHAHENSERTRAKWNAGGVYLNVKTGARFDPENPPEEITFRWHSLIDYPWAALVKEWLAANVAKRAGVFEPLVNFFQKRCAEMRSERSVLGSDLPFTRIEMPAPADATEKAWPEEQVRVLTVDRQSEDVYWAMIRGWSKAGESRRLWYGRLYGETAIEAKRAEYGVAKDCTLIDSGYQPKGDHGVYSTCIKYGMIAAKGTPEAYFWHSFPQPPVAGVAQPPIRVQKLWATPTWGDPGEGTSEQGRVRCRLLLFSSPSAKDRVMGLIKAGLWIEPKLAKDEMDRECAEQMAGEFKRPRVNKFTGRVEMVWVCPKGNNHALDCAAMQVLAALQMRLIPAGIELGEPKKTENTKGSHE